MYEVIPAKKSMVRKKCNYEFKDFASFYKQAALLTVPLQGRYVINVITNNVKDISEFLKREADFSSLMVNIYTEESVVDYITLYDTGIAIADKVSAFDQFKELVQSKNLLIEKRALSVLYASIEHSYDEMNSALNKLVEEFGEQNMITEKMLSMLFILNKVVYPRQVLLSFLKLDRYRDVKLRECLNSMGNDVALGATIKNIKSLLEEKTKFLKTGKCKKYLRDIDIDKLLLLYRVFVLERGYVKDVTLLYELYERGLSPYDIIQGTDD